MLPASCTSTDSESPYIRARGRGERSVRQAFPGATIIRPGAMFGPGDALFGTLADLAGLLPVWPLIGGGSTRLQPVFVQDGPKPWFVSLLIRGLPVVSTSW
jgi:uncharacterized protein YbjT (DUF2867 family)